MPDGLSPFEINRQVREQRDLDEALRRAIQRTAATPNEIRTVVNFGIGVCDGEGDKVIVQVVKPDGEQLHLVLRPEARRALMRELEAHTGERPDSNGGAVALG